MILGSFNVILCQQLKLFSSLWAFIYRHITLKKTKWLYLIFLIWPSHNSKESMTYARAIVPECLTHWIFMLIPCLCNLCHINISGPSHSVIAKIWFYVLGFIVLAKGGNVTQTTTAIFTRMPQVNHFILVCKRKLGSVTFHGVKLLPLLVWDLDTPMTILSILSTLDIYNIFFIKIIH